MTAILMDSVDQISIVLSEYTHMQSRLYTKLKTEPHRSPPDRALLVMTITVRNSVTKMREQYDILLRLPGSSSRRAVELLTGFDVELAASAARRFIPRI